MSQTYCWHVRWKNDLVFPNNFQTGFLYLGHCMATHLYTSRAHLSYCDYCSSSSWCYYCDCFLRCQKMQQAFKKQQKHSVITMYKTENKVLFCVMETEFLQCDLSDRLWLLFQLNLLKWQEKFSFSHQMYKKMLSWK